MVGSRFPFRESSRREEPSPANRAEPPSGNRIDAPSGNRIDAPPGNRLDRSRDPNQANRRPSRDRPRAEEGGEAPAPAAPARTPDLTGLTAEVEALVRLMTATDVSELQIENGALKILIRRAGSAPAVPAPVLIAAPALPAAAISTAAAAALPAAAAAGPLPAVPGHEHPAAPVLAAGEHLITSPMVGTFYAAPAPQESPYVVEGDEVTFGQTIGIVEAMKMMNPIEVETPGRVTRILVRDAQGVEYGQPLMVIAEG